MKKRVLKKWATRVMFASDMYAITDNKPELVIIRSNKLSAKFIGRALSSQSFKHFMRTEFNIHFMPNIERNESTGVFYMRPHLDKFCDYYFKGFMNENGEIEMFLYPIHM